MTIACLGEALIDLAPPTSIPLSSATSLSILAGGAPLNVAIGLTRLGSDALFVGCLSEDALGRRIASLLEDEGVRRHPASTVPNQTRLALIDHADDSAPFRFYGDAPADTMLSRQDVVQLFDNYELSGLYVSSLMMTHPAARRAQTFAINQARHQGVAVFCDPNPRPAAWKSRKSMEDATSSLLKSCTIGKISLDDARNLGWPTEPEALLTWCAGRFDAQMVITDGKEGCFALVGGEIAHIPPFPVEDVDPTGAGDAFTSALIHGLRGGSSLRASDLRFAAAAGALATTESGALGAYVSEAAIAAFLEQED